MDYVFKNFFTHKDYLIDASQIPGTLYSPLHIVIESIFMIIVVVLAIYLSKNKKYIKSVFKYLLIVLIVLEVAIVLWDSFARRDNGLDLYEGLSLYPCSIFMYVLPLYIWGSGKYKKMAVGYISTLGLVGALINLIYPYRLTTYSIISFLSLHSIFYHASMLFVYLVLILSKEKVYRAYTMKDLFYPCLPTLALSIPSNIINYFLIDSDYMYFKGYHPIAKDLFPSMISIEFTLFLYILYIFGPVLFYLPSYIKNIYYNKRILTR